MRAADAAAKLLRDGEIVALPTETVYGLAADALNPAAVAKIFEAKERPRFDPLIVHLPGVNWLEQVAEIKDETRALLEKLIGTILAGTADVCFAAQRNHSRPCRGGTRHRCRAHERASGFCRNDS